MFDLLEQIKNYFPALPPYLFVFTLTFIILPTIVAFLLRYCLYRHLHFLSLKARRLLRGERQGKQPRLIETLETRLQQSSSYLEKVNTLALIEATYSQEKFRFLLINLGCESINYFCRTLPNLLLAFGLFGTFLGITINLASLSQTITKVNVNDVNSLISELNIPLQGMGVAFISSLVAVACSSFLIVVNLTWNTNITKLALINYLEDYCDNLYLPQINTYNPTKEIIENLLVDLQNFFLQWSSDFQEIISRNVAKPIEKILSENERITSINEKIYSFLQDSSQALEYIENSASIFEKSANTFESSRFPDKLSSATADLAIAQNQFSQSSLVLNKSTQSLELTIDSLQKYLQKMIEINIEISSLNDRYATMIALVQKRNVIEEAGLNEIKNELAYLVEKLKKH